MIVFLRPLNDGSDQAAARVAMASDCGADTALRSTLTALNAAPTSGAYARSVDATPAVMSDPASSRTRVPLSCWRVKLYFVVPWLHVNTGCRTVRAGVRAGLTKRKRSNAWRQPQDSACAARPGRRTLSACERSRARTDRARTPRWGDRRFLDRRGRSRGSAGRARA